MSDKIIKGTLEIQNNLVISNNISLGKQLITKGDESTSNVTGLIMNASDNSLRAHVGFLGNTDNGVLSIATNFGGIKMEPANGTTSVIGPITVTSGGNTASFGNLNSGYCHFINSANIPFYFNKTVEVEGDISIYSTNYHLSASGELNASNVKINNKVTMQYNTNEDCLDFIFA